MTIGLALIAKDEEDTLPRLLASIEGAFDQVALLDTGSTDRTVDVFEEWAEAEKERQPGFVSTLGHFTWVDDFAAARNAADALLETDWLVSLDCDDSIMGVSTLRQGLSLVPSWCLGLAVNYEYIRGAGDDDKSVQALKIIRRGAGRWQGRVDEHRWVPRDKLGVAPSFLNIIHHASLDDLESSRERDRQILDKWLRDEPASALALATAAVAAWQKFEREPVAQYLFHYLGAIEAELERASTGEDPEALERLGIAAERVRLPIATLTAEAAASDKKSFMSLLRKEMEGGEPPAPSGAPKMTRQQRRAEARARAKELAA